MSMEGRAMEHELQLMRNAYRNLHKRHTATINNMAWVALIWFLAGICLGSFAWMFWLGYIPWK